MLMPGKNSDQTSEHCLVAEPVGVVDHQHDWLVFAHRCGRTIQDVQWVFFQIVPGPLVPFASVGGRLVEARLKELVEQACAESPYVAAIRPAPTHSHRTLSWFSCNHAATSVVFP